MKEQIKQKYNVVKTHVKENRNTYLAAAGGLAVGVVAMALTQKGSGQTSAQISNAICWKPRSTLNQTVVNFVEKSTPSKPVHLKGTDLYFDSLSDAARKTGHPLSTISKQVNGHIPNVHGDVFEVLSPA